MYEKEVSFITDAHKVAKFFKNCKLHSKRVNMLPCCFGGNSVIVDFYIIIFSKICKLGVIFKKITCLCYSK